MKTIQRFFILASLIVSISAARAQYAGTYAGTYSGGDHGVWRAVVDSGTGITAYVRDSYGYSYYGSGTVDASGGFVIGFVDSGASFSGHIAASGGISGSWNNPYDGISGSFSGKRLNPAITTSSPLPSGILGATYSQTLKASGGATPYTWSIASGSLPADLTLSSAGVISGIPKAVTSVNFTVRVTSKDGYSSTKPFSLAISLETTKPTVTIVSPKTGRRWSNDVFTVTGKAADNAGISAVWVRVNTGAWELAGGTTNWSGAVSLAPGPNAISACAMDVSGNYSAVTSVSLVYVLCASLVVDVNGFGTVSPNYNGKLLEIGKTYTMTAKAGKGYAFQTWSGSASTSLAKCGFIMASNLSFTANFRDIARPVCVITAPKAKQRWSNEVFTVTGKATDNTGVDKVWYQLNDAGWNEATFDLNHTNWSVTDLALAAGTNVIQAFATDAAGNVSLTNTIKFVRIIVPDKAPDSLVGKTVSIPSPDGTLSVCFGVNTFSQSATKASGHWGVGSYAYTKISTNTAELSLVFDSLPGQSGRTVDVLITLTNWTGGVFTNATDPTDYATFSVKDAATLAPATLEGKKVAVKTPRGSVTVQFGTLTYVQTGGDSQTGAYTYTQYSPIAGMLIMNVATPPIDAGATSYALITFTTAKSGTATSAWYDSGSSVPELELSTFTVQ